MTEKQRGIAKELENLVHHRTNERDLNKHLSKLFGTEIKVEDLTDSDRDWTGDWRFAFNVCNDEMQCKSEEDKIGGFFDIYFLKMRENEDGMDFYITEVAYEFCDY
jgi:hypothetical protein